MSVPMLRERAAAEGLPLAIVAAEVLHVILHLIHGAYRYSEDLYLAGAALDAETADHIVGSARGEAENLVVQVLGTGQHAWRAPRVAGRLSTYWYHFTPEALGRRNRVKIEFARFPVERRRCCRFAASSISCGGGRW